MYTIVQSPHQILRNHTKKVDFSGNKLKTIIDEMIQTMLAQKDPEGVGLAANQVNLPYSLFVARFGTTKSDPIFAFVNPEIIDKSSELQKEKKSSNQLEGCLSLPKFYGFVKRHQWIVLRHDKLSDDFSTFETVEEKFEKFPAVVIQHEIDHLHGKIFVERILEQKGSLYQITGKDQNGEDVWEEVKI